MCIDLTYFMTQQIYIYIYIYTYIQVNVLSSQVQILTEVVHVHFTLILLEKVGIHLSPPPVIGKIAMQTEHFSLSGATSLGEGQLLI